MLSPIRSHYDIIINGGGIVGFSLLKFIQSSKHLGQLNVLLIEQAQKPNDLSQSSRGSSEKPMFSNRVSSITKSSRQALEKVGVWQNVAPFAKDVNKIHVWNEHYKDKIVFHDEYDELMFTVVENNRLSLSLLSSIYKTSDSSSILWGHSLSDLSRTHGNLVQATLKDKKTDKEISTSAPLILGCDGFSSKVRDFAGFKYRQYKLDKTALVGTVKMNSSSRGPTDTNNIASQRFSRSVDSVAALLPLDDEHSSFVISAPTSYAEFLKDCDEQEFVIQFNKLFNSPETVIESVITKSRATFPLIFGTTSPKMVAPFGSTDLQIALLGDATHRIHPLAGQGLNLGIQDAICLVRHLDALADSGERLCNPNDLGPLGKAMQKFEIERQLYVIPMMASVLAMPHAFKMAPSKFLSIYNRCDLLKKAAVSFAQGPVVKL